MRNSNLVEVCVYKHLRWRYWGELETFIVGQNNWRSIGSGMDEDASMPDLEGIHPEEELLLGDRGYVGFFDGVHFHIDGVHIHIARPGIELPVNADYEVWYHLMARMVAE